MKDDSKSGESVGKILREKVDDEVAAAIIELVKDMQDRKDSPEVILEKLAERLAAYRSAAVCGVIRVPGGK